MSVHVSDNICVARGPKTFSKISVYKKVVDRLLSKEEFEHVLHVNTIIRTSLSRYNNNCIQYKEMKQGYNNTGLGLKKGAWTAEEDMLLKNCIEKYGEGKWHLVPLKAGLNRCRKSCRLRWLNYLRPNIKRGDFGADEVDLILRLHKLLGNRWALIAGRIPGRTANDVKNYWNTHIRSRSKQQRKDPNDDETMQETSVTIIKPQPRTFTKTLNWYMGDNPHIVAHDGGNLRSSNDIVANNFSMSSGLLSSANVLDDKIEEYLDDLFDDREKEIDRENIWSFGGSSMEGEALNVIEQEDDRSSLFDIPMDDILWELIDSGPL